MMDVGIVLFLFGGLLGCGAVAVWWALSVLIGFDQPTGEQAEALVTLFAVGAVGLGALAVIS